MAKGRRRIVLGLIIGAVFLVLAFRRVEFDVLLQKLHGFNFWWLPLFIASHLATLTIRSWRWKAIVQPIRPVRLKLLFPITVRGFLISNLVPMKAGDLYRFLALSQRSGLSKATSLATLVVERLADLTGLALLSALLATVLPLPSAIRKAVIWTVLAGCLVLALWWSVRQMPRMRMRLREMEHRVFQWMEGSLAGKVIESLRQGLAVLKDARQWLVLLAFTGFLFVTYSVGVVFILRGFDIRGISPLAPLALLAFVFWSSVLPQAPAGVGTFEYASVLALQIFGVGREEALAVALVMHTLVIVNLLIVSGLTYLAPDFRFSPKVPVVSEPAVEGEGPPA